MYEIVCKQCGRIYDVAYRRQEGSYKKAEQEAKRDPQTKGLFLHGWGFIPEDGAQQCFRKGHELCVRELSNSWKGVKTYGSSFKRSAREESERNR